MENAEFIEFRFDGNNISLENVNADEIGEIIKNISGLIKAYDVSIKPNEAYLTIDELSSNCIKFKFKVLLASTLMALPALLNTIDSKDINTINQDAKKNIIFLRDFVKEKNVKMSIQYKDQIKEVSGNDFIEESFIIESETVLYGELVRLGGVKKPKACIVPTNRIHYKEIPCSITKELAINLKNRLYTEIGVKGLEKYNMNTDDVESFRIDEILPYKKNDYKESFEILRQEMGHLYKKLDPDEYIKKLRGEE